MARISTGTLDGFYLELVSAHLPQHSLLTSLDDARATRVRDILNRALHDVVGAIGLDADAAFANERRGQAPRELD